MRDKVTQAREVPAFIQIIIYNEEEEEKKKKESIQNYKVMYVCVCV